MLRSNRYHPLFSYAIALVVASGAFEAELWLRRSSLDRDLFVLSYGAVLISAWFGGLGPGLLAIGVSSALTTALLLSPGSPVGVEVDDFLRVAIFVLIALMTSSLVNNERRALSRAEAALQKRSDLMSAISHDLRGPLTVIRTAAQLLQRELKRTESTPDGLASRMETIERASTRMADQIDELLDAARLDAGQDVDLERAPMNLVAVVEELVAEHCGGATPCRIRLDHSCVPELIGEWDRLRVTRVLDNLISNALKYSPDAGAVEIRMRAEGNWAVIEVEDHGIGIARRDVPHVFERFWRGANATRAATGAGIGLASARDIIQLHGGRIAVESTEGIGSVFTVYLPLSRSPVDAAPRSFTA